MYATRVGSTPCWRISSGFVSFLLFFPIPENAKSIIFALDMVHLRMASEPWKFFISSLKCWSHVDKAQCTQGLWSFGTKECSLQKSHGPTNFWVGRINGWLQNFGSVAPSLKRCCSIERIWPGLYWRMESKLWRLSSTGELSNFHHVRFKSQNLSCSKNREEPSWEKEFLSNILKPDVFLRPSYWPKFSRQQNNTLIQKNRSERHIWHLLKLVSCLKEDWVHIFSENEIGWQKPFDPYSKLQFLDIMELTIFGLAADSHGPPVFEECLENEVSRSSSTASSTRSWSWSSTGENPNLMVLFFLLFWCL